MGRWIIRAALALLALVVIAAQLDHASLEHPALALIVPAPLRSEAQSPIALIALSRGNPATARAEAQRLVYRRPLPAQHLFTLGLAEMRSGRPQAFETDFRAASMRGWRFAPLQVTAAQAALSAGDAGAAANRIAALWAAEPDNPALAALTTALLADPQGAEAFAAPLAATHVWSGNFLAAAPGLAPPSAIIRTVRAAHLNGARFDCAALARLDEQLAARGRGYIPGALACGTE